MKISNLLGIFLLLTLSCNSQHKNNNMKEENHKYTNALINETSPYLLQHAHNPVNWHPWNEESAHLLLSNHLAGLRYRLLKQR